MNLIAAPGRAFKTYSMWIAIAAVIFNSAGGLLEVFTSLHLISPTVFAAVNATLAALIGASKLIQQTIAVSPDDKAALVAAAQATPVKAPPPPDMATQVASLVAAELAKRVP